MHKYTVEFRIYGEGFDPLCVTKNLNLAPSTVRLANEAIGTSRSPLACWGYDGRDDGGQEYWDSLEDGLMFLLNRLERVKDKLDLYRQAQDLVFWCGHFQSSFDGGPTLSPALLQKLSEFGVGVFIDNYFSSAKEDDLEQWGAGLVL